MIKRFPAACRATPSPEPEKNGTSGSVEHVPGIGRRSSTAEKLRGVRCARRCTCARTRRNISERNGWSGRERRCGWSKAGRWEGGGSRRRSGKSLAKGAPFPRLLEEERQRRMEHLKGESERRLIVRAVGGENGVVVRSFAREGSVLGSRNMA